MTLKPGSTTASYISKLMVFGLIVSLLLTVTSGIVYFHFSKIVDNKLSEGRLAGSLTVYSAPRLLSKGATVSEAQIISELRRAGYSYDKDNSVGSLVVGTNSVEVHPGPGSYFRSEPATLTFDASRLAEIVSLKTNQNLGAYLIEPQPIATLSGADRGRKHLVTFSEIPKSLVNALLSAEDKHFFEHMGFDALRIAKAAYVNIKNRRKEQGGSTLTMQLARNLYLDSDKNWRRKASEFMIALILEHKLSKEAIFEFYANQVYLGRHNTFSIHGFGEASRAFFDKDVSHLTLAECALLAGIVQRPSYFDPVHHPDRVLERRNLTLALMHQNGFISAKDRETASAEPLKLASPRADGEAPYFIALATEELHTRVRESPTLHIARVYTTLDPDLQSAALEAVRSGMAEVDKRLAPRRRRRGAPVKQPQVALIALDPHTGEVKALVGGREYGASQLNHILSKRQPGSVFKPFVYATALSKHNAGQTAFTTASMVLDAPRTFHFDNLEYEPTNHGDHFYGRVTFRTALAKSMNVAAVSVAEEVGYKNVADLARSAGLNDAIQPTPAIALGAYETTPLEISGAYTVFANSGTYVKPSFLSEVRTLDGMRVLRNTPEQRSVLDPKVAFLMQEMLREVLRSGTGAGVKSRGFTAEAAGKTGTSRDGWFAGFTSDLLCVVWVGYDENQDLDLEGARSALPIWTEFMKHAVQRGYANALPKAPSGVVSVPIDPGTGLLASPSCERRQTEYFINGSAPRTYCSHERPAGELNITDNSPSLPRVAQSQ